MDVAIAVENLEVRYGDVVALTGLNLSVPVGSWLAIVGANGSGKSTLLGALAGLHKPASGTAHVIDSPPSLVLQSTWVDAGIPISVRDTVKLARYPSVGLFRRFRDSDNAAVTTALKRMQVDHLERSPLHHLSGGERQRVLIAQGLAQDSRVLLLDEPMSGLDITTCRSVLDVLHEEVAADRTVVMTTHSLTDAREADLVLLLDTAPIALGPPDEVLTEPNLQRAFGRPTFHLGGHDGPDGHPAH